MKVERIDFNWYFTNEGEEYSSHTVGMNKVVEIQVYDDEEPNPKRVWAIVLFEDGHKEELLYINRVIYFKQNGK